MRKFCSGLVRAMGKSWTAFGWTLWIITLVLPYIPLAGTLLYPVYLGARILLGLWWLCDLVDQEMITTLFGSVILLLFVVLVVPSGSIFFIVSWLVYMSSLRRRF